MTSFNDVRVRCPFFVCDDGRSRIVCEGIADGSTLSQRFQTKQGYKIQMNTFCCDKYDYCEIYRVLIEKWEYEDGSEA